MQMFCKSFGETVTESFEQDGIIIISSFLKALRLSFFAQPSRDSKTANIIALRRAEIGDTEIRLTRRALRDLLTEAVEMGEGFAAGFVRKDLHIIALLRGWPEAKDGIGANPFFLNNFIQHSIGVFEQIPRGFTVEFIFQNSRIAALKLPCRKERCPIDKVAQFFQWVFLECFCTCECRLWRRVILPIRCPCIALRFFERQTRLGGLTALMRLAGFGIFRPKICRIIRLAVAKQLPHDANRAAGICDVNSRTGFISWFNLHSRMGFGCCRSANQ